MICNLNRNCIYSISDGIFQKNKATINGGAIETDSFLPTDLMNPDSSNTFTENTAAYGNIMSTYGAILKPMPNGNKVTEVKDKDGKITKYVVEIADLMVSGISNDVSLKINLLDKDGVHIVTDSSSMAEMWSLFRGPGCCREVSPSRQRSL